MSDDVYDPEKNKHNRPAARGRMTMPREIEENLKRVYQASMTEPVPDRFAQLLAQLRAKEGKS